jgi:hypothetical protein
VNRLWIKQALADLFYGLFEKPISTLAGEFPPSAVLAPGIERAVDILRAAASRR